MCHTIPVATELCKDRTFHEGDLVATLMAELSRVGIAQRIATARKQAGLDQHEFADLMHVHWRTVQDWESVKKHTTPWDRVDEIANVTGVSRNWMLHGEDEGAVPDVESILHRLQSLEDLVERTREDTAEALELLRRLLVGQARDQEHQAAES